MTVINVHGHLGRNLLYTSLRHHYTGDEVVRLMDEAGIDVSIVFPPIWVGGEIVDPNYEQANTEIVDAARKYPSRLIGFARVNPNFGRQAVEELKRRLDEDGLNGLKLHPSWDFFSVTSKKLTYPLMEIIAERNMPLAIHTGYAQAEPGAFWTLARDFPDVPMFLLHAGYEFVEDAIQVAAVRPNVYLETGVNRTGLLARAIREIGVERVVFGCDMPFLDMKLELDKVIGLPWLTDADRRAIAGGTARRILKLNDGSGS